MIVACGFVHAGIPNRDRLVAASAADGHQVLDLGTHSTDPIDYPDKALEVGHAVLSGEAERGILVCGSGAGVSVAACKIDGIRASMDDTYTAAQCVLHDDCNVLALGARVGKAALASRLPGARKGTRLRPVPTEGR